MVLADRDTLLCQPSQVQSPGMLGSLPIHVKRRLDIVVGCGSVPPVDLHQMLSGLFPFPPHDGETNVLHPMTTRAKGNELDQCLGVLLIIVLPHLMAFDWMGGATTLTDLTPEARLFVLSLA